jgi:hypothetical protein
MMWYGSVFPYRGGGILHGGTAHLGTLKRSVDICDVSIECPFVTLVTSSHSVLITLGQLPVLLL